jgi:hypothetical protein
MKNNHKLTNFNDSSKKHKERQPETNDEPTTSSKPSIRQPMRRLRDLGVDSLSSALPWINDAKDMRLR